MCDSGLDLGPKDIDGTTGKIWIKSTDLLTVIFDFLIILMWTSLALIIVIWLYKILVFGDLGEDYMGILCTTFTMFC